MAETNLIEAASLRFGEYRALVAGAVEAAATTPRDTWRHDAVMLAQYDAQVRASGAWPHDAPLTVIDLAPAHGERAWQLLRLLADIPSGLRYVAACRDDTERDALRRHPALQAHLCSGQLDVHVRPGSEQQWGVLLGAGKRTGSGPIAILAHGLFSALRHDLHACHYGEWMDAWLAATEDDDDGAAMSLNCRSAAAGQPEHALTSLLRPAYLRGVNSATLLLPTGAVDVIDPLIAACDGRYLLIASDAGASDLARIRSGGLAVTAESVNGPLPVNFHALAMWHESLGAQHMTWCEGIADGAIWQVSVQDDTCVDLMRCLPALRKAWRGEVLPGDDLMTLAQGLDEQLDGRQAFALWQASGYAPQVMIALQTTLGALAMELDGEVLPMWREALRDTCARHFTGVEDDGFHRAAACIAASLGDWGEAVRLLEQAAELYGGCVDLLRMRAYCQQRCGDSRSALDLLAQAMRMTSDDADLLADQHTELQSDHAMLAERMAAWAALPWYAGDIARADGLVLEPLGPEHAVEFFYQYRDPQIGMMTRLPAFADVHCLMAWMRERGAEPCRAEYAMIHPAHGFVGVISAHWVGRDAFCHFWIGADFQGQGLASRAIQLLRAQAARMGLRYVFTTAYPDNFRSLRALQKSGFVALNERALPPENEMPFFGLALTAGEDASLVSLGAALRDYCARSGGVFAFPTPHPHALAEMVHG